MVAFEQARLITRACWYQVVLTCCLDLWIFGKFDKHTNPEDGEDK